MLRYTGLRYDNPDPDNPDSDNPDSVYLDFMNKYVLPALNLPNATKVSLVREDARVKSVSAQVAGWEVLLSMGWYLSVYVQKLQADPSSSGAR